jgi:hypothetical protein
LGLRGKRPCRRLHNEELKHYSGDQIKKNYVGENVARTGERIGTYRVRKPKEKGPLRRPRRRWGIILKWIVKKWNEGMDWIDLSQDRDRWLAVVNTVMNLGVP